MRDGRGIVVSLVGTLGMVHLFGCWGQFARFQVKEQSLRISRISSGVSFEVDTPCCGVAAQSSIGAKRFSSAPKLGQIEDCFLCERHPWKQRNPHVVLFLAWDPLSIRATLLLEI
jgi:hypothetical protein